MSSRKKKSPFRQRAPVSLAEAPEGAKAWVYFFGLWIAYMAFRNWITIRVPSTDWESYAVQDAWVSAGRGGLALVGLAFLFRRGDWRIWNAGLNSQASKAWFWTATGLLIGGYYVELAYLSPQGGLLWQRVQGAAVVILVAFNEEIYFRGFFLDAATKAWGSFRSAWIVAAAFMLMHIGYVQEGAYLPIFMTGMLLGRMRQIGVSMAALILIHIVLDLSSLWFPTNWTDIAWARILHNFLILAAWILVEFRYFEERRDEGKKAPAAESGRGPSRKVSRSFIS
jgi:membrane protease YdiL (CAAX protease family)